MAGERECGAGGRGRWAGGNGLASGRMRGAAPSAAVRGGALAVIGLLALASAAPVSGQLSVSAHGIGLVTHASPAVGGESYTEAYVTQPMVLAAWRAGGGRVELSGILNLEGVTLAGGELNAGIWGEGFVDRRHPHTYLHELTATLRAGHGSLTAGRGFAPFGTDDPMARPFVKYPANHHLAQILERTVVIGALTAGPVTVEAAVFNGDEPTGPGDLPDLERFGDSWSGRATVRRGAGWEAQASHAYVVSPELPSGAGLDHRQWSASVRYEAVDHALRPYAMIEWARSTDVDDGRDGSSYATMLAEAAATRWGIRMAARLERTERPEEERLLDPFRTQPHVGGQPLGVTRWTIGSLGVSAAGLGVRGVSASPLLEVALLSAVEAVSPSFFVPAQFYGSERMWSLSAGIRLAWGPLHARMGRYGAAVVGERHPGHD